tara:strand:+ start:382 stop:630 length:249 start_codon:yes stop_codon:yes gene_type:complete
MDFNDQITDTIGMHLLEHGWSYGVHKCPTTFFKRTSDGISKQVTFNVKCDTINIWLNGSHIGNYKSVLDFGENDLLKYFIKY